MMEWILLLGIVTGLRTMTAIAVLCWAAWLNFLPQHGWASWAGYLVSALIFGALAIGEYIGDTLPTTPSRKAPGPAAARLIFGALVGALAATAIYEPVAGGILVGLLGAAIGTWGGWWARRRATEAVGRDLPVALGESALALLLALAAMLVMHHGRVVELRQLQS